MKEFFIKDMETNWNLRKSMTLEKDPKQQELWILFKDPVDHGLYVKDGFEASFDQEPSKCWKSSGFTMSSRTSSWKSTGSTMWARTSMQKA